MLIKGTSIKPDLTWQPQRLPLPQLIKMWTDFYWTLVQLGQAVGSLYLISAQLLPKMPGNWFQSRKWQLVTFCSCWNKLLTELFDRKLHNIFSWLKLCLLVNSQESVSMQRLLNQIYPSKYPIKGAKISPSDLTQTRSDLAPICFTQSLMAISFRNSCSTS